ncbi:MAG: hypothetical protein H6918_09305 [Sphingomonadaceae bacterium]|nr:hypothetical protein [Sphingomonadaceae bacterium]
MTEGDCKPVVPALYLLFPAGKRPFPSQIHTIIADSGICSVSFDPTEDQRAKGKSSPPAEGWLELLSDGLTFDLAGMVPDASPVLPAFRHQYDFVADNAAENFEALQLTCGPHLASGATQQPVMRLQLRLARDLARHVPDLVGVGWSPCDSVMSKDYFGRIMDSWLGGGPFPGLGLVGYRMTGDGALLSEGLDVWTGQEVQLEGRLAQDRAYATRLAVRLVNQLIPLGHLDRAETLNGPDGAPLHLVPLPDAGLIRVLEG